MKKHLNFFIASFSFLLPFTVYLITLFPTVANEDSGELIAAAYHLGIAHPPGYPLYTFLGKIFTTIIPFGNIAWRVNVMSAFFGAATCLTLYLLIRRTTSSRCIGIFSALLLAFSSIFWDQSIRAEVYTLHTFFLSLILLVLHQWHLQKENSKLLYLIGLLLGLGATNHQLLFLAIIPIALFVGWHHRKALTNINLWIVGTMFFALGLSFYLYLPIRSAANPAMDWGNPENSENFWKHVSRGAYSEEITTPQNIGAYQKPSSGMTTSSTQSPPFFSKAKEYIVMLPIFGKYMMSEFLFAFALLGILGFFLVFSKKWRKEHPYLTVTIPLLIFYTSVLSTHLDRKDFDQNFPFYLSSLLIFSILIGYGALFLAKKIDQTTRSKFLATLTILPLIPLTINFATHDNHENYIAYDVAKATLNATPENSVLYIPRADDFILPILYLQKVENFRTDITIYDSVNNVLNTYENWPGWEKAIAENPGKSIFTPLPTETPKAFNYHPVQPFLLTMAPKEYLPPQGEDHYKKVANFYEKKIIRTRQGDTHNWRDQQLLAHYYVSQGISALTHSLEKADTFFKKATEISNNAYIDYYIGHTYHTFRFHKEAFPYIKSAFQKTNKPAFGQYLQMLQQKITST